MNRLGPDGQGKQSQVQRSQNVFGAAQANPTITKVNAGQLNKIQRSQATSKSRSNQINSVHTVQKTQIVLSKESVSNSNANISNGSFHAKNVKQIQKISENQNAQSLLQQAKHSVPIHANAQAIMSMNKASGQSGVAVAKKSNHKRSVSFKTNDKDKISLLQNSKMITSQEHPSENFKRQPPMQPKVTFNVNCASSIATGSNKSTKGSMQTRFRQGVTEGVVSPLRTKQPSINNSRKISKDREVSRQSIHSVQSPKLQMNIAKIAKK